MKSLWYHAELLSDVVVSAHSATTGGHETLDYLPGATLLGVLASQLYSSLTPEDSFTAFHSGELVFVDARPVTQESMIPAIPMPISLHIPKISNNKANLHNFAHPQHQRQSGHQYKQLRHGYLRVEDHQVTQIQPQAKSTRAKVGLANSPLSKHKRNKENQLYTYNAIGAGACYLYEIRALTIKAEHVLQQIADHLGECAYLRIGRSKRTEYGSVQIKPIPAPPAPTLCTDGSHLCFIALSDTAFRDPVTGAPRLIPNAQDFGLPEHSELDWSLTHLRRRGYSPFNGKRRLYDLERQVITRGSVVTFKLCKGDTFDFKSLSTHLSWGLGDYTEGGLGQWLVNLKGFNHPELTLQQEKNSIIQSDIFALPFMEWASRTMKRDLAKVDAGELALKWETTFKPYCQGRNGLSKAQLGTLRTAGERFDPEELYQALFKESGEFSVCSTRGVRAQKWVLNTRSGKSAADTLKELFDESIDQKHLWSLTLQATASRLVKSLNRGTSERTQS